MIDLVIFDMDGVLLNSEPHYRSVNHQIFKDLGLAISPEEHDSFVGLSCTGMWSRIRERYNLSQKVTWLKQNEQSKQLANFKSQPNLTPIAGIPELIQNFKTKGLSLAVGSSSGLQFIQLLTEKIGVQTYFDYLASGEDVPESKPAPDLFLKVARHFQVEPARTLVIEDSHNGVRAAKSAGMLCLGYRNIHSGNQDLSLADAVTDDFFKAPTELDRFFISV